MRKKEKMENEQDKGWSQPYHQKRGDKNQELRHAGKGPTDVRREGGEAVTHSYGGNASIPENNYLSEVKFILYVFS